MRNEINCLLFDFDGVIADTDLGRYNVLKEILPDYDIELTKSFKKKDIMGLSTKGFLMRNSKILTGEQVDEIVKKRHELFFSTLSTYCLPFELMKESIECFCSNYDLAIVTTNSTENVKILLKHLGIIHLFKWIIGREKCETENFVKTYKKILPIIGKKMEECLVIEDSDFGVNAAHTEGFFCIRFDPENAFEKGNENLKVNSFKELRKTIVKIAHDNKKDISAVPNALCRESGNY
jgi:beta-phosphoglucomutase-like phosphatase (HAD superfamily)